MVPLDTAQNLEQALAGMRWEVLEGSFGLVGFDEPPTADDVELLWTGPGQLVCEGGETTLLVRAEGVASVVERHPGARAESDLAWIRFHMPMSWELVGFLGLVTGRLAAAGVPLGAVCGYSRDHLFIARSHLARAREVLGEMFPEERGPA